ncbi:MAG TPA: glycosyltransferase family 2 protein [Terracidiphilus sp.]|jgi:glycosyltransferase involved in cell wall biosynthesis
MSNRISERPHFPTKELALNLTAIILTLNEAKHIARCIANAKRVADRIVIIDSFSTDATASLARALGAEVFQHNFVSHADQFNWALRNVGISTEWVMKLDADEYLEEDLITELHHKLPQLPRQVSAISLRYKLIFMDRWIRFGGRHALKLVRIWRFGSGRLESRLMDEHVVIESGDIVMFKSSFRDHNLNDFSFFISKHNGYSVREATQYLLQRYQLGAFGLSRGGYLERNTQSKRKLKAQLYDRLPPFIAPFLYFMYRYFILLGFLDGYQGAIYHFFQGLWYRLLVAARLTYWDHKLAKADPARRLMLLEELSGLHLSFDTPSDCLSPEKRCES